MPPYLAMSEGGIMNDKKPEATPADLSIEIGSSGIRRILIYSEDVAGQAASHRLLAAVATQLFLLDTALKTSAVVEKELQAANQ